MARFKLYLPPSGTPQTLSTSAHCMVIMLRNMWSKPVMGTCLDCTDWDGKKERKI